MKNFSRRQWIFRVGLVGLTSIVGKLAMAAGKVCGVTPRQVLGPFYPESWNSSTDWQADLTKVSGKKVTAQGRPILVRGEVVDSRCRHVSGAKVQLWQANFQGRYHHRRDKGNSKPLDPGFLGSAEVLTNKLGQFSFKTVFPGTYEAAPGWTRPAHLHFKVIRSGYEEIVTQMYFAGDTLLSSDQIFNGVPKKDRSKLVVKFELGKDKKTRSGKFRIELKKANS